MSPFRGRRALPAYVEISRELTAADLETLQVERGIKPPTLVTLRESHHSIARAVAQGLSGADISAMTGYSQSRISILKSDPAFAELVEHYRSRLDELQAEAVTDNVLKVSAITRDLLEDAHELVLDGKIKSDPDRMESWLKTFMDRSGLGPSSKSTSVNINLDIAQKMARGRTRGDRFTKTIEGTVNDGPETSSK